MHSIDQNDSKDIYNVTKYFYLKKNAVEYELFFIKAKQ